MLLDQHDLIDDVVFEKPEDFRFDRETTLCFTGHRPFHLPGNGDENNPELRRILSSLQLKIIKSIDEGFTTFVTGMAQGVDMWSAKMIMELRLRNPHIKLVAVLPFKNQNRDFSKIEKYDYDSILHASDQVICLSERYHDNCMRERNQYMVDHSSKLIGVIKYFKSGSGMTVNYAKKQGIDIDLLRLDKDPWGDPNPNQLELVLPED